MDITLTPDIYRPSVDNNGNYVDNIPIIHLFTFQTPNKKEIKTSFLLFLL
jgi:hypothetical protein